MADKHAWTLLTPRQARFCIAIINGASQVDAYKKAGYKWSGNSTDAPNASRVATNAKVQAALQATRSAAGARAQVTVDTIVDRLEEARQLAMRVDPPQLSAAVAAAVGQAKVLGLVVDKAELHITRDKPSLLPTKTLELSEDEWKRQFALPPGR